MLDALTMATKAHEFQYRKDGAPYILHPIRVAGYAEFFIKKHDKKTVKNVALLHDVIEDSSFTAEQIAQFFGDEVSQCVVELTNHFTKKDYPYLKRRERKLREFDRLSHASDLAQQVKLCDRLDNVDWKIFYMEEEFREKYIRETQQLVNAIGEANPPLRDLITTTLNFYKDKPQCNCLLND